MTEPVAPNIRKFRNEKGLTQGDLAKLVGVTQQAIAKWESGDVDVSLKYVAPLARALGVSKELIFPELGEINPRPPSSEQNLPVPPPDQVAIPAAVRNAAILGDLSYFVGNGISRLYGRVKPLV